MDSALGIICESRIVRSYDRFSARITRLEIFLEPYFVKMDEIKTTKKYAYKCIREISSGSCSKVFLAMCSDDTDPYAVKKSICTCTVKSGRCPSKVLCYREKKILKRMPSHSKILNIVDFFYSDMYDHSESTRTVFPFIFTNLYKVIVKANVREEKLHEKDIKKIMKQLMEALHHCHKNGVIHVDVKPSNILMQGTDIKLCDFSHSIDLVSGMDRSDTYGPTYDYRPPELLLGDKEMSYAVDIWQAGCVFAEMALGARPFGGKFDSQIMGTIYSRLGVPKMKDRWRLSDAFKKNGDKIRKYHEKYGLRKRLTGVLSNGALDLLFRMLVYDPTKRITSYECLQHVYFK